MKNLIIIFFCLCLLFISGCIWGQQSPDKAKIIDIREDIKRTTKQIDTTIKELKNTTKSIDEQINKIRGKSEEIKGHIPPDDKTISLITDIQESSTIIIDDTSKLRDTRGSLATTKGELKSLEIKIEEVTNISKALKKERDKALKEVNKLKQDMKSGLVKLLQFIIVGCIIGIGFFGALAFFGNIKGGIFGASACGITLFLCIIVGEHITLISWIGLGIVVFGIILAGFHIYKERKTIKEAILTTEEAKKNMDIAAKEKVFGNDITKGIADDIQSSRTIAIIKKERDRIKKKLAKLTKKDDI